MMRAVLYARVSTSEQAEQGTSLDTQIDECRSLARDRGYEILGEFSDDVSGTTALGERPGLLAAFETGADILVVHDVDRLARENFVRAYILHAFTERGMRIEFVRGGNTEDADSLLSIGFRGLFGDWERLKILERTGRAKREKARRGKWPAGRPPFGYRLDPAAPSGLSVDNREASLVRKMFELYLGGYSIRQLAVHLVMARTSVAKVLRQPAYAGTGFYNRRARRGAQVTTRAEAEWIPFEVPAIVDPGDFARVQAKLEQSRQTRRREPQTFYMLRGMVVCEACGRPFYGHTQQPGHNRRQTAGRAYRHRRQDGGCSSHWLNADRLEAEVWRACISLATSPEAVQEAFRLAHQEAQEAAERQERERSAIGAQQKRLQARLDALTTMRADGEMTQAEYLRLRQAAVDELERVKFPEPPEQGYPYIMPASEFFSRLIPGGVQTPQSQRQTVERIGGRVVVRLDGAMRLEARPVELLSTSSRGCVLLPQRPPGRVWRALAL